MRDAYYSVAVLAAIAICSGCAKPDHVDHVESPTAGLFFTVETRYGRGAMSPDVTRVYAHLEANGKSDRQLVLDGEYLEKTKIIWLSSSQVTLCIPDGYTDSFRTYVTLRAGAMSETIRSHLQEHCNTGS
jgi:hypothetical protein